MPRTGPRTSASTARRSVHSFPSIQISLPGAYWRQGDGETLARRILKFGPEARRAISVKHVERDNVRGERVPGQNALVEETVEQVLRPPAWEIRRVPRPPPRALRRRLRPPLGQRRRRGTSSPASLNSGCTFASSDASAWASGPEGMSKRCVNRGERVVDQVRQETAAIGGRQFGRGASRRLRDTRSFSFSRIHASKSSRLSGSACPQEVFDGAEDLEELRLLLRVDVRKAVLVVPLEEVRGDVAARDLDVVERKDWVVDPPRIMASGSRK